jgi:glucosamine--fructose-6-phosphate aminotransferase (isomerizing)
MCGIVGGVAKDDIVQILLDGLKALEYRGYDSSGIAMLHNSEITRVREVGKVANLEKNLGITRGTIGIAHTRWATHGKPSKQNAHPHICNNNIAVVHNGIIENFNTLKEEQIQKGYKFTSHTDTETITHEIFDNIEHGLLSAVQTTIKNLQGAYGLGVISKDENRLIAARLGSPLVIGIAENGNFIASDKMALLGITKKFITLKDGDIADITSENIDIYDKNGKLVEREIITSSLDNSHISLGEYQHFMQKEIFEQPSAISDTLEGRISENEVLSGIFGTDANEIFSHTQRVQIIACGTSYNAGLVAKYWLEDIAKIPTNIEVASEYRYRNPLIIDNTLFIFITQSGETADTIEALKMLQKVSSNKSLAICNSSESTITNLADLTFLTHAGPEIGVASTKAFTTQLTALALLTVSIAKVHNNLDSTRERKIVQGLKKLPKLILRALECENDIKDIATTLGDKHNALFLGRGTMSAIASEGALKLKEISYIHAESYPAGELKHGPIALIDEKIPVIVVAPNNELLDKLKSNLAEVKSRGSQMVVFEDELSQIQAVDGMKIIPITHNLGPITAPIIFSIPLQLLSYHTALIKGTDVDKPRNLAKSVTVE